MNETKAEGFLDEAKGKIKQAWGDVTGNDATKAEGTVDVVKGKTEQTWGGAKENVHDALHSDSNTTGEYRNTTDEHTTTRSNSLGDDISAGAQHLKESVQNGLDNLKRKTDD